MKKPIYQLFKKRWSLRVEKEKENMAVDQLHIYGL